MPTSELAARQDQSIDGTDGGDFDALFEAHFQPLTRQVARMVECEHVAEELVQDVFFRMWRGRDQLEVRGDLPSYLRRAARNRALDWLRREELHREWEQMEQLAMLELPRLSGELIWEDDETARRQAALVECLETMPARRRVVCELRWREGIGPSAIAARLGISVKTVEAHITVGAKQMKTHIKQARFA